jgi:hypothetical protein
MIELTPFKEADWCSFSDAQRPDVGEPMVGGVCVAGDGWTDDDRFMQYATITVDRVRVQVIASDSVWQLRCLFEAGLQIARQLSNPLRTEHLRQLNFQQIA